MKIRKIFSALLVGAFLLSLSVVNVANAQADPVFDDVSVDHVNGDAVKYLKDEGVVVGYDDGTYRPDQEINRAEFLKIVMEAKGMATVGEANCYKDVSTEWFAPYVCGATKLGLVNGYDDGYFRPEKNINFVEASKIIANAFILSIDPTDTENWYAQYVKALELVNAIPSTVVSFSTLVTRGETAEMVWRIDTEDTAEESKTYDELVSKIEESHEGDFTVGTGDVTSINLWENADYPGKFHWEADGYSEMGFKVVWSKNSAPTYPVRTGDKYKYYSDPAAHTAVPTAFDGSGTYYVRVCEYLGGECGVYSNEVSVYLDEVVKEVTTPESVVSSITVASEEDGNVTWSADTESTKGYKVVWSKTSGPTYPVRDGDKYLYYSDPSANSALLDAFDGDGTYYVRVCEYLGGECGTYSNEIEVELFAAEEDPGVSGVNSLTLSNDGDGVVSWVVDGSSEKGYKLVWSMTPDPTYPLRDGLDKYLYYSDPAVLTGTLDAFDGAGTYYVRVCEYLGGECGVYSNELEVDLL